MKEMGHTIALLEGILAKLLGSLYIFFGGRVAANGTFVFSRRLG